MADKSKFFNKTFLFKVGTVVFGVVDLGFVAHSYSPIYTERPFLSIVSIAFILSFLMLVAYSFGMYSSESMMVKHFEIFYHFIAALLLFMTGSVFLFSVFGVTVCVGDCRGFMAERYLAALLGLFNGFVYALVAWNMLEVKIVSRNPA